MASVSGKALIVMVGVPASGKSTLAKKIADEFGFVVVSTDAIRAELLGNAENQSRGAEVFDMAYGRVISAMNADDSNGVIFDATSLRAQNRRQLKELVPDGVTRICVVCDTPLDVCLERNSARDRVVPPDVIRRMSATLAGNRPSEDEGFIVVDSENVFSLLDELKS